MKSSGQTLTHMIYERKHSPGALRCAAMLWGLPTSNRDIDQIFVQILERHQEFGTLDNYYSTSEG